MKYDYFGKDHLLLSCYEEMYTVMSNWIRFIKFNYMKMVKGLQCEFADKDKTSQRSHLNKVTAFLCM